MRLSSVLLVAALAIGLSGPALAQGRIPEDRAPGVQPLDRILPEVRRSHPGEFYDADGPVPDHVPQPWDIAAVIYTSGTTGRSKGVRVPYGQLWTLVQAQLGYMTAADARGRGVARKMCVHSLEHARAKGFTAMQFNLVVTTNKGAIHLWQSLGFQIIGVLPQAFDHPAAGKVDALVMYRLL